MFDDVHLQALYELTKFRPKLPGELSFVASSISSRFSQVSINSIFSSSRDPSDDESLFLGYDAFAKDIGEYMRQAHPTSPDLLPGAHVANTSRPYERNIEAEIELYTIAGDPSDHGETLHR